ncbi:MAG: hypothetical protein KJS97_07900 [Alphaproteobacteria bacterium]|nr:hypothetical protein [Alphaproteobacteria bacterium]
MNDDDFYVGWRPKAHAADRRFLLGAAIGLGVAALGAGAALGARGLAPGPGEWRQDDLHVYSGLLMQDPYLRLRFRDTSGDVRDALVVGYGKNALPVTAASPRAVTIRASAIERGRALMLAVPDPANIQDATGARMPATPAPQIVGETLLVGELVDAKCWYGAMRPGYGKPHKGCAALCIQGRLPIALCTSSACGDAEAVAPLLVDENGAPHGPRLAAFAADPIAVTGVLVRSGDLLSVRAAIGDIRRLG